MAVNIVAGSICHFGQLVAVGCAVAAAAGDCQHTVCNHLVAKRFKMTSVGCISHGCFHHAAQSMRLDLFFLRSVWPLPSLAQGQHVSLIHSASRFSDPRERLLCKANLRRGFVWPLAASVM